MRVLVVDDTDDMLFLACAYVEEMGHEAVPAASGAEALEVVAHDPPDMVLMDVMMPGMDGYEVTRRIRQMTGEQDWIPVIFLSAMVDDASVAAGIEAGGDDYLTKPISEIVLQAKINAMDRITQMRQRLVNITAELEQANKKLAAQSLLDGLTGVANRRHFDQQIDAEWRRARNGDGYLGLLMMDVDYFKNYNDSYGHLQGDECLRQVARAIDKAAPRSADFVARYGGEEFAVIMPDTDQNGLTELAERIRSSVEFLKVPHRASSVAPVVTVSIGAALARSVRHGDYNVLISRADEALYCAKGAGRNRVELMPA